MIVIFFSGFTPFALSLYIRQVFANMNGLFCMISQFSKTDKNKFKIIVLESQIKQAEEAWGYCVGCGYAMVEIVYNIINNCIFRWKPFHGVHIKSESQFVTPILQQFVSATFKMT